MRFSCVKLLSKYFFFFTSCRHEMTWKRFYRPLCRLLTQSKWQISFCVWLAFVSKLVWMWMQQAEIASISISYWSLNGIYVEQLFSEDVSTESRLKMSISHNTIRISGFKNMQIKFQFIYFLLKWWHCLYSGKEHILKTHSICVLWGVAFRNF